MQRRTVLLVPSDDCGWVGVRRILDALSDVSVVGEAASPRQALHLAADLRPDVVVVAARLDGVSTVPLLAEIRGGASPASKLVVVGGRLDPREPSNLADLRPAAHLILGDLATETLRHLLAAVIVSDVVVVGRKVADAFMAAQRSGPEHAAASIRFTEPERAVLRRLAEGLTETQIAEAEPVSRRSVSRIVAALETKLDAPTLFALGRKADRLGLLD